MSELPVRKPNRLSGYDYSRNGRYYITVCAKERLELFAKIDEVYVGAAICRPRVCLTDVGRIIDEAIGNIPTKYPTACVDTFVIMPNHLHLILEINNDDESGRQVAAPTIQTIIGQLKRYVSKQCGYSVWQKSFHDHIIRNETEYLRIARYIETNPQNWKEDSLYPQ
jgi:REP element-mobilizing transposase RayT